MKFTFLTFGTEGDTRPLVALAHALIARGHRAEVLADGSTAAQAHAYGVPFTALAGRMHDGIAGGGALADLMRDGGDLTRVARACARIAQDNTTAWMRTARSHAVDSDVLVFSGLASYAGLAVADGMDLPCVGAGLWPMTPTRAFGSVFMRPRPLPGWANRLSHMAFAQLSWVLFRSAINAGRRAVFGAAPRYRTWQGYSLLLGCSSFLLPRPDDWPDEVHPCGAWYLPPRQAWTPPAALTDFLDAGEAPLYVGFGSMAGFDRSRVLRAVIEAMGGRRTLFFPGWSGIDAHALPANFHVLRDTPHDWLLPRTALVVHHGGAGTSHAAARAGVPSVVVPFAGDQFFWAERVRRAGIGTVAGPAASLDGDRLRSAIEAAATPAMRQRALTVGQAMREEDGVRNAVDLLLSGVARPLARATARA